MHARSLRTLICTAALLLTALLPASASAVAVADLSMTATGPSTGVAGTKLTYTVTLTNAGPNPATNASWTLPLPAGMTYDTVLVNNGAASDFTCTTPPSSPTSVTCSSASFPAGSSAQWRLDLRLTPTVADGSSVAPTFTAAAATQDPNGANNTSQVTTGVTTSATVSTASTDHPDPVVAGQVVTYSGTVTNAGPSAANSVVLRVNLPFGTTLDAFVPPPESGPCTQQADGVGEVLICPIAQLPPGSTTYSLRVRVPPGFRQPIDQTANVTTTTPGTPAGGVTSLQSTKVTPLNALLALTATAPETVLAGQPIAASAEVRNTGPDASYDTRFILSVPPAFGLLSAVSPQGACSGTFQVTCSVGLLQPGETASVVLSGAVPAGTAAGTSLGVLFQAASNTAMAATAVTATKVVAPTTPPTPPPPPSDASSAEAVLLTCAKVQLRLISVERTGSKVRVGGLALRSLAGKAVTLSAAGRTLGKAKVAADGTFAATVRKPRGANAAIVAAIGTATSVGLRVERRIAFGAQRSTAAGVVISGTLRSGRAAGRSLILRRLVGCSAVQAAGTTKADRRGRFTIVVPRPSAAVGVVSYRLTTTSGGATFSLPVLIRPR